MNVLVLGGTRFIGLRLVGLLHRAGRSVTVLNRGQTDVAALPEGVARLRADRSEPDQVKAVLRGKEYDAAFDFSGYNPADLQPVVDSLEGRVGHYVFCSSVAAYPPSAVAPIAEDHPLQRDPEADGYSRGKVLCEDMLVEAFSRRGFPATMVRPPYVYGPYNHIPEREFSLFARARRGRPVLIPGEGLILLHPVHVDDLATAFTGIVGCSETLGEAYNATGPDAITENGLVRTIAEIAGGAAEIVHLERREYETAVESLGPSDASRAFGFFRFPRSLVYTNDKLRRDTGWSPQYDVRDGLAMTFRWWLDQGIDVEDVDFSADDRVLGMLARRPPP